MIFRRRRERIRREQQEHLDRAKRAEEEAKDQQVKAHELIEESEQVFREAASMRAENHFIETYLDLFKQPRRRLWPGG